MKRIFISFGWLTVLSTFCPAAADFQTPAFLIEEGREPRKIELVAATGNAIRYRDPHGSADVLDFVIKEGVTVQVIEPREFTAAMDLYRARRYEEARKQFVEVKEHHRPVEGMEDSYSTLAAFYEMECLRREGDLKGLAAALQKFSKGPLSREYQNRQLELYVLWDAIRTKSWERLEALAGEWAAMRLPGDQRAQVAWCEGLALEGLGKPDEALIFYQTAITADAGASEEITREAALRILAIYQADPEVQAAIRRRGDVEPAGGQMKLAQAEAVAALFELSLGEGSSLPPEFRMFQKTKSKK